MTFRDSDEAKKGITQLHGLKFLDKTLSAEFSKEKSYFFLSLIVYLFSLFFSFSFCNIYLYLIII